MKRRQFIVTVGASAITTGLGGCATPDPKMPGRRPNILFIIVDQHRADCIGAYGNREVRTPHLDALAAEGVRYANSFCAYPVCTPSRYSLFSGLYVHEHGGSSNRSTLRADIDTFPRILRDAGYNTAAVGKMHFTPTYLDIGFQQMFLAEQDGEGRWDDDYHRELMQRGLIDINDLEDQRREYRARAREEYWETFGALPTNLPADMHSTEWIGRKSIEILEEWGGDDANLLVTSFVKPHHPFDAVLADADKYDPAALSLLPGWTSECFAHDLAYNHGYLPNKDLTEERLRRVMAYYYATIEQIDRQVGEMIAVLKRKGLYENTMIVYLSDHGEYMGHHHMLLKGNYMYDALARVPLIIRYPRGAHGGEVRDGLVSLIDLAPTVLRQADCVPGAQMHGINLVSETKGRDTIFAASGRGQTMVRTRAHKLMMSETPKKTLLYDLERDPNELNDVYGEAEYAPVLESLKRQVSQWGGELTFREAHLDLDAPKISGANVPPGDLSHRQAAIDYYEKAWDAERFQRASLGAFHSRGNAPG
ncbi:MAG: sulfatase-like hydrolase/transferase [Candidatus Hydrogenedentes bacterium]|nr:sulfatase-like hydrolase/transferase [Candidatus Hydrogenedentota bacterium]